MVKPIELICGERPICRGKDVRKAKQLNNEQWAVAKNVQITWELAKKEGTLPAWFVDHLGLGHICDECKCQNYMGQGTGHEGIGYCARCEKHFGTTKSTIMLEKSAEAVTKYDSFKYMFGNKYLEKIRSSTPDGKAMYDLSDEISLMRSSIQEMLSKISPEYDGEMLSKMNEVLELSKERCLDKVLVKQFEELVRYIQNKLEFGFTESSKDGPVPASDKTVSDVLTKQTTALAKLLDSNAEIKAKTFITRSGFDKWLHTVISRIRSRAPDEKWMQDFIADLIEIPDPK